MLETVREFALEQLDELGEIGTVRAAHAEYFTESRKRLCRASLGLFPAGNIAALGRDRDNIRAALRWYDDQHDAEQLLRLAAALGLLWEMDGPWREGQAWLEKEVFP